MKSAFNLLMLTATILVLTGAAIPFAKAQGRNCTQTCYPTYGGGSTCNMHCY